MVSRIWQIVSTCARNSYWILQKWQIKRTTHSTTWVLVIWFLMTKAQCKHTAKSYFSPTASASFTVFRSIAFMIPSARSTLPIAAGVSRGSKNDFTAMWCQEFWHATSNLDYFSQVESSGDIHKAKYGIFVASVVSGFCNIHPYKRIELKLKLGSYRMLSGAWLSIFTHCASDQTCTLNQFSRCLACLQDWSQGLRRRMPKLAVKAPNGNACALRESSPQCSALLLLDGSWQSHLVKCKGLLLAWCQLLQVYRVFHGLHLHVSRWGIQIPLVIFNCLTNKTGTCKTAKIPFFRRFAKQLKHGKSLGIFKTCGGYTRLIPSQDLLLKVCCSWACQVDGQITTCWHA